MKYDGSGDEKWLKEKAIKSTDPDDDAEGDGEEVRDNDVGDSVEIVDDMGVGFIVGANGAIVGEGVVTIGVGLYVG